jgi:L-ascorbate metabolism protein UlaG (beta-lactamase superfamily)
VFAFRVEVRGRSFHVQGSAGIDDEALARQRPADVLIACLAARRGTPRYLERLADRLAPRVLVPCHHDDFFRPLTEAPRPIATLRWKAFLDEAAALGRAHGTALARPARFVPWSA